MTGRRRRLNLALVVALTTSVAIGQPASATDDGQWYIGPYQINEFHAQGIDGSGVTVAVVDTAINVDVPQLQGADIEVKEPSQCYAADGSEQSSVSDDPALALHGTNVVSYIVGNGTGYEGQPGITGIAPKAKILFYSVRTQSDCVSTSGITDPGDAWDEMVSTAVIDATDKGADIISFSIEASTGFIEDALAYAMRHGVIVVASLKNHDSQDLTENFDGLPAINNGVIGVGAFGHGVVVPTGADGQPSTSAYVDVVAPGMNILIQGSSTDWHAFSTSQGTSMATPITAGNIALAIQKYPDATHNQIIQSLIRNTGAGPHELSWDTTLGYGIVDTISLLAADPAQYEDVNPLLSKEATVVGPTWEQVMGTESASPSPSPSPTASAAPTGSPVDPATDSSSPGWLLFALVGGGVLLIIIVGAIVIVAVKSKNRDKKGESAK